ncbi:MAG: DNA mismatch repair protein MutS [Thermomicrobiales bacterium]
MTTTKQSMTTLTGADGAPDVTGERDVPLRRQYLQIKSRFPDTILLFRLGDFYETFDGDAEIAAKVLDIVLTGREMGKGQRVPMAGIPHHAAESHIGRLITAGHKVAVCEQVGQVSKGRGLVDRDVTRIVTPGTILDPTTLDGRSNNFIAAVVIDGPRFGVASADVSTGEFTTTEAFVDNNDEAKLAAARELLRLQPAEIVLPDGLELAGIHDEASRTVGSATLSRTEAWRWQPDRARDALHRHFQVDSLDGYGCAGKPFAIVAAGALLQYVQDTQVGGVHQIAALSTYSLDQFMTLDAQTRRNLELTESGSGERRHSLIGVLDQARTSMGARLLRRWIGQPLLDLEELRERHDRVEFFVEDALTRAEIRRILGGMSDIERLVNRAVAGIATPRDLSALRASLALVSTLQAFAKQLTEIDDMPDVGSVYRLLNQALVDDPPVTLSGGTLFRPGFAPELDGHHRRAQEARDWIAGLERTERERTGVRSLKVGYNKVFGYYIELTAAALANAERELAAKGTPNGSVLPADYIPKQTLANATRYFTPQLKEYEIVVLTAQETLSAIEASTFRRLVAEVAGCSSRLLIAARALARLDTLSTLAEVAVQRRYVRPELDDSTKIEIVAGRHPTIETVLGAGEFVPNDAELNTDATQIVVLTGPNMAGKSSWLRQTALIVLMAQIGSFVPAERARIGLVDRIFTRIGAHDDIATGQSTFMVEMLETANILHHATRRSLVILDEIGRGTSTYDGLAIARAIIEYLHNSPRLGGRTLFATHFHELTELERVLPRVRTSKMDVLDDGERIVFLRHVVPGGSDRSYGLHVAQLAGMPKGVVRRAQEILDELEHTSGPNDARSGRRAAMRTDPDSSAGQPAFQLTFFGQVNPAVDELKRLEIEAFSPLEAITKLFELQRLARET